MNLDELERKLLDDFKEKEEKEKLYEEQSTEIALGLSNGKKVDDGYYIWGCRIEKNICIIAAARKMLIFTKGYRPMTAKFELNNDYPLLEQIKEVVKIMLKKQNGDYSEEMFEVEEEDM